MIIFHFLYFVFCFILFYFSLRSTTLVTNSRKGSVSLRLLPLPCLILATLAVPYCSLFQIILFSSPFFPSLALSPLSPLPLKITPGVSSSGRRIVRDPQLCFALKGHSAIVPYISSSYQSTHNTRTRTSRTRSSYPTRP